MGNESSIATSINSLSDCLDTVEKRLFAIEDIHFHHQASILVDNCVIISGVKIVCNPEVKLLVGPVLGTIGSTFIRVLVEVDQDCELTIHVFRADKTLIKDRHFLSKTFIVPACVPKVEQVDGLVSGESYVMYIGGLSPNDTINLPLECQTVNSTLSNYQLISASPGQVGSIERDVHDFYSDLATQLSSKNKNHSNSNKQLIIYLNGDILSLDMITGKYIMDLLAAIDANTISDNWISILNDFEVKLNTEYRQFFNHYVLQSQGHFRRCAWMLIAGNQECSMQVYLQHAQNTQNTSFSKNTEIPHNDTSSIGKSEKDSVTDVNSKKTPTSWISKKKQYFSAETPSNNPQISSKNNPEDDKETSKSIFGAQMKSRLSSVQSQVVKANGEIGECHRLLISAAVRVQRKCYWKYLRQLWDENYDEDMMAEETEMEERLRKVLSIKSSIIKQSHLLHTFQTAQQHNDKLFNTPDTSTATTIAYLTDKLQGLNKQLLQQFHSLANHKNRVTSMQDVKVLSLGNGLCIVVVDGIFGFIEGSDGLIKNPMPVTMELTTENWRMFENIITQSNIRQETQLRLEPPFTSTPDRAIITSVIFLSNSTFFDPQNLKEVWGKNEGILKEKTVKNKGKMSLSKIDFIKFLRVLSTWQSQHESHSVLINTTTSNSSFHSFGYLDTQLLLQSELANYDFNNPQEKLQFITGLTLENVKTLKTTLKVQIMGKSTHRQANFVDRLLLQQKLAIVNTQPKDNVTVLDSDEQIDFASMFVMDSKSRYTKSGVFITCQHTDHTTALTSIFKPFATAHSAQLKIKFVIGQVTSNSANILLESAIHQSGFVEVLLVDVLTGYEFVCGKSVMSHRAEVFMFTNMAPNHSYELRLVQHDTAVNSPIAVVCSGGFTTMPSSRLNASENRLNVHRSHLRQRMREQAQLQAGGNNSNDGNGDVQSVDNQMSITSSLLHDNNPQLVVQEDSNTNGNKSNSIKLLCLGSILPSTTQRLLASITASSSAALQEDLEALRESTRFLTNIAGLCKQPWNGIDVVLHLGSAVDWSVVLPRVIALLAQAEQQAQSQSMQQQSELVNQAIDHLRDAYRICWGEHTIISDMLAHSSHHFISSPLTSLLQAMHTSTIRQLERDLSPFIVRQLLLGMQTVQGEYQQILSQSSLSGQSDHSIRFIGDSLSTMLVDLQPRLMLDHNADSNPQGLLAVSQLEAVRQLLIAHATEIDTLIFASPLPLVLLDELYLEHTFSAEFESSLHYSLHDVLLVLDLCASWLLSDDASSNQHHDRKQVVFLCAATSVSFESTILIFPQADHQAINDGSQLQHNGSINTSIQGEAQSLTHNSKSKATTALKSIQQICCGPVLGLANSFSSPLNGMLYSRTLPVQFGFGHVVSTAGHQHQAADNEHHEAGEHVLAVQKPLVGLVEISQQPIEIHLLDGQGIMDYTQAHIDRYSNDNTTASRLQDDEIQADTKDLIVQVMKHLYYVDKYPAMPGDATDEMMVMLKDIFHAVDILINRERTMTAQVFELLSEGKESPMYTGERLHEASAYVGRIVHSVFAQLSDDCKEILRLPNGFIVQLAMEIIASEVMGSDADGSIVSMLMTRISADRQFFEQVVKMLLCTQLVSECVALQRGLLD